jgi:hypothetical protein
LPNIFSALGQEAELRARIATTDLSPVKSRPNGV